MVTEEEAFRFILGNSCSSPDYEQNPTEDRDGWCKYTIELHCDNITVVAKKVGIPPNYNWEEFTYGYEIQSIHSERWGETKT